jgi:photosystem II stability/assembly factor-like uncharacterized protein
MMKKNPLNLLVPRLLMIAFSGFASAAGVVGAAPTASATSAAGVPAALDAVACPSTTECIAVGGSRGFVLVSRSGGLTWSHVSVPTKRYLYGVACANRTHCVAVGDAGTALFTKNSGKSWALGDTGVSVPLSAVSCPQSQHCEAVGDHETVLATRDGGLSWSHVLSQFGVMNGVSCSSPMHCTAVTSNVDVSLVTDNGSTWTPTPGPFSSLAVLQAANGLDCLGLICVEAGDYGLIAHSINGGASWLASSSGTLQDMYAVSCASTTFCVAVGAAGIVLRTSDGGSTWASEAPSTRETLLGVSCSNTSACVAVGSGGTIMTSTDGAANWTVRAGAPAPSWTSILVVGDSFSGTLAEGLARNAPAYGVALTNGALQGCALARGEPILLNGRPFVQNAGPCAATGSGWEAQYQMKVARLHPALTVLVLGPFDLSTRLIGGRWESPGQAAYDAYYREQVSSALEILTSEGGRVVITKAPYVRTTGPQYCAPLPATVKDCPSESQRVAALDSAARQAATAFRGRVSIVDLGGHLAPHGTFASTVDGVVVRAADGVHLSEPGGEWLTPWLLPRLIAATRSPST